MRRITAIALVLCVIIALVPVSAAAATTAKGTYGNVQWKLDSNGQLRIFGAGSMGMSTTNTTANAAPWREYAGNIKTVVIEEGVTTVGSGAFLYCPNLTKVTIPSTVEIIGERAFYRCRNLGDISIPAGVTTIKAQAFAQTGLTSVTLPQTVTTVSAGMFYDCTKLTTVTFNGAITDIGESAFSSCDVLASVNFKKGLSGEIGVSAFSYCPSITAFEVPEGVVRIMDNAFIGCTNLASITLPEGLKSIWGSAFRETALVSVTIPQSVDYMGAHVFVFCDSLKNVTMHTSTVEGMTGVLGNCDALEYVHIIGNAPETNVTVFSKRNENFVVYYDEGTSGWVPPTWNGYLIEIWGQTDTTKTGTCGENMTWTLKSGVLTISGTGSMVNYSWEEAPWYLYRNRISRIVVEDGVASIGDYAFAGMDNVTSVTIAGSVVTIGKSSFYQCYGLTEVNIPSGVVSIGSDTFEWCTNLTTVTMSDSVTALGSNIFTECGELTSIKLSENITELPSSLFLNCRSLAEVDIPDGVTAIGSSAFSGCFALHTLVLPDGVETVGVHALSNNGLTSITIPASVKTLGFNAFCDCRSLNDVYFVGDAPVFDGTVFQDVTATCVYPAGNKTWTADVMQNYGGNITWVSSGGTHEHTYHDTVVSPTCTDDGYTVHTCACGDTYQDTIVPATGHRGGMATCVQGALCEVCGVAYCEKDPANHTGETEIRNRVEASEFADGYSGDVHCKGCGELLEKGNVIPATHIHSFAAEWSTDSGNHWHGCACGEKTDLAAHVPGAEPTETSPQVCTICGWELKPAIVHTHKPEKVEFMDATHEADGYEEHYACACGALFADAEGTEVITEDDIRIALYELGDVDHDHRLTSMDAMLLMQYKAGLLPVDFAFCTECADVDGKMGINSMDAMLILQFRAGLIESFR